MAMNRHFTKRRWFAIGACAIGVTVLFAAWLGYRNSVEYLHLPAPSLESDSVIQREMGKELSMLPARPSNSTIYVWTDNLPPVLDVVCPGLDLRSIYIGRANDKYSGATEEWLVRISGDFVSLPDEVNVSLGEGLSFKLTACPKLPFFGRWGPEAVSNDLSNRWWKHRTTDVLISNNEASPNHRVLISIVDFSKMPVTLPPDKEAYLIRPPMDREPGKMVSAAFGRSETD
jgi:hypothetical protein